MLTLSALTVIRPVIQHQTAHAQYYTSFFEGDDVI